MLNEIFYRWQKVGYGATFRLWKQKVAKSGNNRIRVCFFYEEKRVWLKSKSVYDAMLQDERFEPFILVIPNRDLMFATEQIREIAQQSNVIYAYDDYANEWYDLQRLKADFVFYARPYGSLLPECYRSSVVSRYSKICYIPYGAQNWCLPVGLEKEFLKNVSIFFADDTYSAEVVRKFFPISYYLKLRTIADIGYPFLAEMQKECGNGMEKTPWWNTKNEKFRVVWTPRWTVDEDLGGSHFFEYKDFMLHYFAEHQEASLVFRPHPLAINNWIEKGKMTQKEADDYLSNFETEDNLHYDNLDNYHATFGKADVLVTDYSSIIVEYFITGKPIIYCSHDLQIFNVPSRKIMKTCYLVDNWKELEQVLSDLEHGIDPLKQERKNVARQLQKKHDGRTVQRILDILAENL